MYNYYTDYNINIITYILNKLQKCTRRKEKFGYKIIRPNYKHHESSFSEFFFYQYYDRLDKNVRFQTRFVLKIHPVYANNTDIIRIYDVRVR